TLIPHSRSGVRWSSRRSLGSSFGCPRPPFEPLARFAVPHSGLVLGQPLPLHAKQQFERGERADVSGSALTSGRQQPSCSDSVLGLHWPMNVHSRIALAWSKYV